MNDQIITRQDAKAQGLKRYFTGEPCKHGHVAERLVSNGRCAECRRKYYEANSERAREHYEANREQRREYYEANRDKIREYYAANRDKRREYQRERHAAKPGRKKTSKLRKLNRVPAWADVEAIDQIYAEARRVSEETGVQHHVDHVIPLNGESVSGLHVDSNLQILSAAENVSKGNSYAAD